MPVKRRLHKGRPHRINDAAIEAWRAGDWMALHRALDLKPWECSPMDVADAGEVLAPSLIAVPDDWPRGEAVAVRLRRELLDAAGAPGEPPCQ